MHPHVADLIAHHRLAPHPEGGHYRRIYEAQERLVHNGRERPLLTAIRFLLAAGERSAWHRVDAEEAWHWEEGDALELLTWSERSGLASLCLGSGDGPSARLHVVPAGYWQAARPLGRFTLVACTVSPGFVWEGFELLEPGSPLADVLPAP